MAEGKLKGPIYGQPTRREEKLKGPVYAPGPRVDLAPKEEPEFDPVLFLTEVLRNFNDSLTFGLYDKGVDAVEKQFFGGSGDRNQKLTENSGIAPRIIGQTLGGIPGGLAFERALVEAVPVLGRNTLPSIFGRNASVNAGMSAADDMVRDQEIDPLGVMVDAGAGGILGLGLAGASRYLSPGARVRARGNDLTLADKLAAEGYAGAASDRGILLDAEEALRRIAPKRSADVAALKNSALDSPAATEVKAQFDAVRAPGIREAGRKVINDIGGMRSPFDLQMAAREALEGVEGGFRATASVPMSHAATKKIPPTHIPQTEAYAKAASEVMNDPVAMEFLDEPAENSVAFLEEVRRNAARKAGRAKSEAAEGGYTQLEGKLDQLLNKAGGRAGYTEARRIADQGVQTVKDLKAGPLGRIAKATSADAQGKALLNVANEADAAVSREAAQHLPDFALRGILANAMEGAAARSKTGSIRDALPNEHAGSVASDIIGDDEARVVVDMLSAIDETKILPHLREDRSGPIGQLWSVLRDYGRDGVMKLLQDPKWIRRMGGIGPVQNAVEKLTLSLERETTADDKVDYFDLEAY